MIKFVGATPNFAISVTSQKVSGSTQASSSGHSVWVMGVKEEQGSYNFKVLTQTSRLDEEGSQHLESIGNTITRVLKVKANVEVVTGIFASGSASCTEIGVPFIKAMYDPNNPKQALEATLESSRTQSFEAQDIANIRLKLFRSNPKAIDNAKELIIGVSYAQDDNSIYEHVINYFLNPDSEIKANFISAGQDSFLAIPYREEYQDMIIELTNQQELRRSEVWGATKNSNHS